MITKCVVCGSEFESKTGKAKYCCKKCWNHSRFSRTLEQIHEDNEKITSKLIDLYNSGLKDKEIALRIGKSHSWVQKKRVELGLQRHIKAQRIVISEFQPDFRSCKRCSSIFIPKHKTQVYCSVICEQRDHRKEHDTDRRHLERQQKVDYIPLKKLYERDNGICYLCGGECDWNAKKVVNGHVRVYGNYPSREHIKPLSKGGLHSWSNVKLAHIKCNSSKGVKYDE